MLIGRTTIRRLLRNRRLQSVAVLFCFVVSNLCPILPGAVEKDHSERYPCESHACGCRSAEHCWRKCCCFTREQKLAWAKAHGVTPPAEVLLAETKSAGSPSQDEKIQYENKQCEKKSGGCCAHKSAGKSSCCSKQATHETPAKPQRRGSDEESRDVIVVSQFLGCQGIALVWLQLQVTLPQHVVVQMAREPFGVESLVLVDERTTSVAAPPDAPPPRMS